MTRIRVFRIASMTKVAAMQLVEAGKLALDEPIGRVLLDLAAPMVIDRFGPHRESATASHQTPDHPTYRRVRLADAEQ